LGTNFLIHETPICLFGLRMVQGRHVDAQQLVCQSPPSPADRLFQVQVTVSLDGGVTYFKNSTRSYEYYALLSVQDFYPQLGVMQGGTSVTVSATGVRNVTGITCRFGVKKVGATILRNSAIGEALLQCISPPHAEGLVSLAVSLNGQDAEFALASAKYNFHRPLVPSGIWPTAGPITGGTLVTLAADQGSRTIYPLGEDLVQRPTLLPPDPMPVSQWVVCKVGADTMPGRQLANGIECRVTPCTGVNASGMIRRMQVSVNGQEFVSSDLYRFLCAEMPLVDAVEPSIGPAELGSRVTISGRNFSGTTRSRCLVGNLSSPATVINTTTAFCYARPITPMNISRQSRDFVKASGLCNDPTMNVCSGEDGSKIGMVSDACYALMAKYAGGVPACANFASKELVTPECKAYLGFPCQFAGSLGVNRVTLAVDGQHYSAEGGANFSYYQSPAVHKIDPPSATTLQGPVTVTLTGRGFTPYEHALAKAQCRFGNAVVTAYVNSSEAMECTAPAQASGIAVLVELSFNQQDFEGHNSVFFLRLALATQVETVSFRNSLNVIEMRWRNATDRATFRSSEGLTHCGVTSTRPCGVVYRNSLVGPFKCDMVLAASDAVLGSGALCRWHDNLTLAVSLGASPTLVPGDALTLLPSAVMQGSQLSYYSSTQLLSLNLASTVDIPTPVPIVLASTVVAACQDMVLDASMSYNHGGRPFNFSWTLVSFPSSQPSGINISTLLEAQASSGAASKISFPSDLLAPGEYMILLVVTSWFGRSASTTVTVTKSTASNMPSVSILGPKALTTRSGMALDISALVRPSTCSTGSAASAISLQWSVQEQLAGGAMGANVLASSASIIRTAPVLRLPQYTLRANKVYLVQVTAIQNGVAATASASITAASGAVVAWISGGDRRAPHNENLWLNAFASWDPDAPSSTAAPLRFTWQCQVVNVVQGSSAPCTSVDAEFKLAEGVTGSGNETFLPLGFTLADPASAVTFVPLGSAKVGQRMCASAATGHLCGGAWDFVFSVDVSRADGSGLSTASVRVRIARANTTASVNISSAPCATSTGRCKVNVNEPLTLQGHVFQSDNPADPAASSAGAWVTSWSTWQGDIDVSQRNLTLSAAGSLTLVLKPNVLTQGALYTFRLSTRRADAPALDRDVSADASTGYHAQIVVQCNAAPAGGGMRIDRTRGVALTSNFALMAVEWTDDPEDMPLRYSFLALINATSAASNESNGSFGPVSSVVVISSSLLPRHVVPLPMGSPPFHTVDLLLRVEDGLGAAAQHAGCRLASDAFRHIRIVATQSSESGWEAYYRTIEFYDERSGLIQGGKATGSSPDAALAFDNSSDTKYRTQANPGSVGDWIALECPNPVVLNRLVVRQFGGANNHINAFNVEGSTDGGASWTLILSARNVPVEFDSDRETLTENVVWRVGGPTQMQPCRVEVIQPATGAAALLSVLEGEGAALLARASVSEQSDVVFGVVGAMLSILNSPSINSAAGSRRQGAAGSSQVRARALRDAIVTSISGFLEPSRVPLLSSQALAAAASTLKDIASVPAQVSPTLQRTLTTLAASVVASPDTGRSSTISQDAGAALSSLRKALEHSRLNAGEMNSVAALEQQDRLEAAILSLTRGAISSHSPGQDAVVLQTDTFLAYGRVLPVRRAAAAGGLAMLETRHTVLLEGREVYPEWKTGVSVLVPDVPLPGCVCAGFVNGLCFVTVCPLAVCSWRS
jgi:hypothetical protein